MFVCIDYISVPCSSFSETQSSSASSWFFLCFLSEHDTHTHTHFIISGSKAGNVFSCPFHQHIFNNFRAFSHKESPSLCAISIFEKKKSLLALWLIVLDVPLCKVFPQGRGLFSLSLARRFGWRWWMLWCLRSAAFARNMTRGGEAFFAYWLVEMCTLHCNTCTWLGLLCTSSFSFLFFCKWIGNISCSMMTVPWFCNGCQKGNGAAEVKGRSNNTLTDLYWGHGLLGKHTAKCPVLAEQLQSHCLPVNARLTPGVYI